MVEFAKDLILWAGAMLGFVVFAAVCALASRVRELEDRQDRIDEANELKPRRDYRA